MSARPISEKFWERRDGKGYVISRNNKIYYINEVTHYILSLCDGKKTQNEIIEILQKHYPKHPKKQIENDVDKILQNLLIGGLIKISGNKKSFQINSFRLKAPLFISWAVTQKCNLACKHCYLEPGKTSYMMPQEEALKIAKMISSLRPYWVTITGGEPLMRKDLFDILPIIKTSGARIYLETNGFFINEKIANKLSKFCNSVQMSIYSSKSWKHDEFTGVPGCFEKVLSAAHNLSQNKVKVIFATIVHRESIKELREIAEIALENGDAIKFNMLDLIGRGKELVHLAFQQKEYPEVMNELKIIRKIFGAERTIHDIPYMSIEGNSYSALSSTCAIRRSYCHINPKGDVQLCEKIPVSLGNLSCLSLCDIWQNSPELRAMYEIEKYIKGKCKECKYLPYCKGGCRAESYLATHDLFSEDPICWINNPKGE